MPVRSAFFGRNKITRRCYDLLREKGTITADEVTVRARREKGLDPGADRKQRTDFTRRILVSAARSAASRHGRDGRCRARREMEVGRHLAGHVSRETVQSIRNASRERLSTAPRNKSAHSQGLATGDKNRASKAA